MKAICMFSVLMLMALFMFSSCSKTDNGGYMCTCTYTANGTSNTIVYDMHSDTKAYAVSKCNYDQASWQASTDANASCHL